MAWGTGMQRNIAPSEENVAYVGFAAAPMVGDLLYLELLGREVGVRLRIEGYAVDGDMVCRDGTLKQGAKAYTGAEMIDAELPAYL